jgi:glutathione S-transferase
MKLYYSPGACSLASHIALIEAGAQFEIDKVDTKEQKTESGENFSEINPNGYVPALRLDNGEILTEGAAVLQFIADTFPDAKLAPAGGALERARLQEKLVFISSELHKAFSPFFAETLEGAAREAALAKLAKRLNHIETQLSDGRAFLTGDQFTIADAYLFVVASWTRPLQIDLDQWPNVAAFVTRIAERPSAQAAMRAEGLIK